MTSRPATDAYARFEKIPYQLTRLKAHTWEVGGFPMLTWWRGWINAWEADACSKLPLRRVMQRVKGLVLHLESRPSVMRRGALQADLWSWYLAALSFAPRHKGRGLWRRWERAMGVCPTPAPEMVMPDHGNLPDLPYWASWPERLRQAERTRIQCIFCKRLAYTWTLLCPLCGHMVCDKCHNPDTFFCPCGGRMRYLGEWFQWLDLIKPLCTDAPRPLHLGRPALPTPPPTRSMLQAALEAAAPQGVLVSMPNGTWELTLQEPMDSFDWQRLGACEALRNVSRLVAENMGLQDVQLKQLLASRHLEGLQQLVLRGNKLTLASVEALRCQPLLRQLKLLDVSGNLTDSVDRDAARALLFNEHHEPLQRSWLVALETLRI